MGINCTTEYFSLFSMLFYTFLLFVSFQFIGSFVLFLNAHGYFNISSVRPVSSAFCTLLGSVRVELEIPFIYVTFVVAKSFKM